MIILLLVAALCLVLLKICDVVVLRMNVLLTFHFHLLSHILA